MAAVREFRIISRLRIRDLADGIELTDVRKRSRHAELRRSCSDTARNHEEHLLVLPSHLPVELADRTCNIIFVTVWHAVVIDRINIDHEVDLLRPGQTHGRTFAFKEHILIRNILRESDGARILKNLQRSALQDIDDIVTVL